VSSEQYGVLIHGRWLETEKPQATVIRSDDGWTWQEMCTTDPETATEIAEALRQVALRRSDAYDEALADLRFERDANVIMSALMTTISAEADAMADAIERQEFDRAAHLAVKWREQQ